MALLDFIKKQFIDVIAEEGGNGVVHWRWPVALNAPHVQYASFAVAALVSRLRDAMGGGWMPMLVELQHRQTECMGVAQRLLGPQIRFNAPRNAIHVDRRHLDRTSATADTKLYSVIADLGNRMLQELPPTDDIGQRTRHAIVNKLESGRVSLETIAAELDLQPRSLQSKLTQAATTFETVLTETRQGLAERYLRDTDLSLTEIALLLGFSELSAFTRAAQRWFHAPPSLYRVTLRNQPAPTSGGPGGRTPA